MTTQINKDAELCHHSHPAWGHAARGLWHAQCCAGVTYNPIGEHMQTPLGDPRPTRKLKWGSEKTLGETFPFASKNPLDFCQVAGRSR